MWQKLSNYKIIFTTNKTVRANVDSLKEMLNELIDPKVFEPNLKLTKKLVPK